MSGCCGDGDVNDLNKTFDRATARADAREYLRRGLGRRDQRLLATLTPHLHRPATVLEIGCGAGGFHHELLRRGLASAVTGVDASSAYIEAAAQNAETLGLNDKVRYEQGDFARSAASIPAADVVVMNRVICCYPDLPALLAPAADRAKLLLALVFPLDNWWLRLPFLAVDAALSLWGSGYHPYLHRHQAIVALARDASLAPVAAVRYGIWRQMVFSRAA
jgi:magnesium-protoporphyrin O-methyltransferase